MYVMCGCLRHGDINRALEHFRQASERGIVLDLLLCESLATALFVKGLSGEATEMEAWNVLEYIRQRGMVHRSEVSYHSGVDEWMFHPSLVTAVRCTTARRYRDAKLGCLIRFHECRVCVDTGHC